MAGTKAKKVMAGLAILLVMAAITMLVLHHVHQYQGRTHFPKGSCTCVGFADPVSALETASWAAVHGDGKTLLAGLTPELQQELQKAWEKKAKTQGVSLEDFLAAHARKEFDYVLGFRVLGVRVVNDHETFVHIYVQGWWSKITLKMKKIGTEWRLANISDG